MAAVGLRPQIEDRGDRAQIEFAIEMRKQLAAARRLPAQRVAKRAGIDGDQKQSGLAEKCFRAVSATCAAAEKWMKPSRRSSALPRYTPCRSASRQAEAGQIL